MNFNSTYKNTDDKDKLLFLNAIIKNNEQLQSEFVNYIIQNKNDTKEISSKKDFFIKIEKTETQYVNQLESVDLENPDWDNYNPEYSGYIKEWEQYQQASEQEFNKYFNIFKSESLDKLLEQNITDFTAMILGLYEACLNVDITDEYESFDGVNDHLIMEHGEVMRELIGKIKLSAISANQVENAIELFFEYCTSEYPGNLSFPKYFEPLIVSLADFSNNPEKIMSTMKNLDIAPTAMPQLVLLLNKNSGNSADWLKNAELLYKNDTRVAEQLVGYYFTNDKSKFVVIANELFKKIPNTWSKYLKDFISEEIDKDLYFRIFHYLTINQFEIEYYNKVRNYYNADTFQKLIESLSHQKTFVVNILNIEKKYEEIKTIVTDNIADWDFNKLITPILNIYPEFCFNTISSKLHSKLKSERGRSAYSAIAETLLLTKQIKGFEQKTNALIQQLYNNKPNLPALKDEFRSAGLM
jgi:hypothetical protein